MGTANSQAKRRISVTNITLVDKGHEKLVEIHTHVKDLLKTTGNKNDLTEIFFALSYFYENYLLKEEMFLQKTGYPNLDNHSASHTLFIKEIEQLKDSIDTDAKVVLHELDDFIETWLSAHEQNYNDELVDYLRGKGFITN